MESEEDRTLEEEEEEEEEVENGHHPHATEEDEQEQKKKERRRQRLLAERERARKRGVCYLSRVPPHLSPQKLRQLLSQYGEILRIYLVQEDPAKRRLRKRAGGNSGKIYTEGWVEFAKKSVAKHVASMLCGEPMGGKKRSAYYYDLWNIKYLRKFKWDNLTEEIAYKNAVREQKLATEISAAKRERDFYIACVDKSRMVHSMEERKKKKPKVEGEELDGIKSSSGGEIKVVRHFDQKTPVKQPDMGTSRLDPKLLTRVLVSKGSD